MRNFLIYILVSWCCAFALPVDAGNGRLYTASMMSSSTTDCVIQDKYGYLWVGTQYGLNRFDGYRFTHYFTDKNDTTSMPHNDVSRILSDSKKRLWVGTARGLCRYDYQHDRFIRYPLPDQLTPRIVCLLEDKDGNILIATSGQGVYAIRAGKDVVTKEKQFSSQRKGYDFVNRLFEDEQHHIWCTYQTTAITRMKVNALQVTETKEFQSPFGPVVEFLKKDNGGFLAVCMYGILNYDATTGQLSDAGYDMKSLDSKVSIRGARIDHNGHLYIGTSGEGLFVIPAGSKVLKKVDNLDNRYGLASANINDIIEDKDHNLWLSCYKKGLYEMCQEKEAFATWKFSNQNYIIGSSVSSIAAGDDGRVWCTVQKSGVYQFDKNGVISPAPTSPAGANCIYRDSKGQFWIGSETTLYSYNPMTGSSTPRLHVDGWGINCMADDGQGNYYICNYGKGLYVYHSETGQSEQLSMYQLDPQKGELCNDWVKAMLLDSRGLLWIATSNGVCVMNPADQNFKVLGWKSQLSGLQCFSLCESQDGNILVGTESGLYCYDRQNKKMSLYPNTQPVENQPIYTVVCARSGDLWMSSANGLWQYDHKNQRLISHVNGNGLESREFVLGAVLKMPDDRICFGSYDGIISFYPEEVRGSLAELTGDIYLTNFMIEGKPVCSMNDRFKIPYDQNSFTLEYSMLNFKNIDNLRYEYRLNNGSWTMLGEGVNSISFNRMKPGTYTIEMRATSNGAYTTNSSIVTVVVRSPWYASFWAYLIYAILTLGVLGMVWVYFEKKRKTELDEQKMRFLINATHDIRSPLSLIMGPLHKLKKRVTDPECINDINTIDSNANKLLLLVNQILDERKIDKKQMHLHCSESDLVPFVSGICALYQYNAQQRNITFKFEHEDAKLMAWIDRIQFDKVVSNILSNAFKYTFDGGQITVTLGKESDEVLLKVTDTGIGFKEEKTDRLFERFYQGKTSSDLHIEGTGIGLNLSRAIVQMHGGHIKAYNRTDGQQGACLEVRIPLGKAHLKPEEVEERETVAKTSVKKQASRNFRILVVDDDADVARYIKDELSNWYRIDTVSNGRDALKMLLTGDAYDLVISDVMMPEMDGITLLRQLKGNTQISDIPVILLTSKAEVGDRLEGLRKGADAYLSKPFNMEELHILIDNLVDNVRRLRGKFTGAQSQEDKVANVEVKGNNDALMERIMKTINENLQDPDFNVDKLTEEVGLSRTQLHRKMKEITGISTGEFIRNLRLQQAERLIKEGKVNIAQVAYSVGFNNQTYFSTVFKKYYGMSPTEYAEQTK